MKECLEFISFRSTLALDGNSKLRDPETNSDSEVCEMQLTYSYHQQPCQQP